MRGQVETGCGQETIRYNLDGNTTDKEKLVSGSRYIAL